MKFDLNKITERGIEINQTISFGEEYLMNSPIKQLNDVYVSGRIYYNITKEVIFDGEVRGIMKLVDANTTDLIDYPFTTHITEILDEDKNIEEDLKTNHQNSLDLEEVLWENIVLEVPIRISNTDKPLVTKGMNWELKDENSKKEDPRLECFRALLDEGKE